MKSSNCQNLLAVNLEAPSVCVFVNVLAHADLVLLIFGGSCSWAFHGLCLAGSWLLFGNDILLLMHLLILAGQFLTFLTRGFLFNCLGRSCWLGTWLWRGLGFCCRFSLCFCFPFLFRGRFCLGLGDGLRCTAVGCWILIGQRLNRLQNHGGKVQKPTARHELSDLARARVEKAKTSWRISSHIQNAFESSSATVKLDSYWIMLSCAALHWTLIENTNGCFDHFWHKLEGRTSKFSDTHPKCSFALGSVPQQNFGHMHNHCDWGSAGKAKLAKWYNDQAEHCWNGIIKFLFADLEFSKPHLQH